MTLVIDASAVLARLLREPGGERVAAELHEDNLITSVNFAEVIDRYIRQGAAPDIATTIRRAIGLTIVPVTEAIAVEASLMLAVTQPHGLSMGDRLCLALAKSRGVPALTADREWAQVADALGVVVEVIR